MTDRNSGILNKEETEAYGPILREAVEAIRGILDAVRSGTPLLDVDPPSVLGSASLALAAMGLTPNQTYFLVGRLEFTEQVAKDILIQAITMQLNPVLSQLEKSTCSLLKKANTNEHQ